MTKSIYFESGIELSVEIDYFIEAARGQNKNYQ